MAGALESAIVVLPTEKVTISGKEARSPSSARGAAASVAFRVAITILFALVFGRAMFTRPDGIYTGVANNVGDLAFHVGAISSFAYGQNSHIEDPTFASVRFTYPFAADYVSALLVRMHLSLAAAMWLPNMVCALAFVWLLARWTQNLTGSRLAGPIAVLLVLFSGGMGWWTIFQDVRNSEHGLFPLLAHLPHAYTILTPDSAYRWGNTLTTLFIPQRSILFGAPLAVFIFSQWWSVIHASPSYENPARLAGSQRMAAAGV